MENEGKMETMNKVSRKNKIKKGMVKITKGRKMLGKEREIER